MWKLAIIAAAAGLAAASAEAQTIYPLDRAERLAGARFDLKVEAASEWALLQLENDTLSFPPWG